MEDLSTLDERPIPLPDETHDTPFRVSELKQWAYCPRVVYYAHCLPDVRPITWNMKAGEQAGRRAEEREIRRSLRRYGLQQAHREFRLYLASARLGLRGIADLVLFVGEKGQEDELIPVDYKLSHKAEAHTRLQVAAYALLLEETYGVKVQRGFLYLIPRRQAVEVRLTASLRRKVLETLEAMQAMLWSERMPPKTARNAQCAVCEFRRFCNDVL